MEQERNRWQRFRVGVHGNLELDDERQRERGKRRRERKMALFQQLSGNVLPSYRRVQRLNAGPCIYNMNFWFCGINEGLSGIVRFLFFGFRFYLFIYIFYILFSLYSQIRFGFSFQRKQYNIRIRIWIND